MLEYMKSFIKDEEGASAVEYGLVVGLIAVALVVIMAAFTGSNGLGGAFSAITSSLPKG